jgi:hypothetical protein
MDVPAEAAAEPMRQRRGAEQRSSQAYFTTTLTSFPAT